MNSVKTTITPTQTQMQLEITQYRQRHNHHLSGPEIFSVTMYVRDRNSSLGVSAMDVYENNLLPSGNLTSRNL